MKKFTLKLTLALFALSSLLFAEDVFTVQSIKGNVQVRPAGQLKLIPVEVGQKLLAKTRVKMGADGFMELLTPMNDVITLKEEGYTVLSEVAGGDSATRVKLDIFRGDVKCKVTPLKKESTFQIKSPVAVAGVRGTEFACRISEQGSMMVAVSEGTVKMSDPAGSFPAFSLKIQQGSKVGRGGDVKVFKMPAPAAAASSKKEGGAKEEAKKEGGAKEEAKKEGGKSEGGAKEGAAQAGGSESAVASSSSDGGSFSMLDTLGSGGGAMEIDMGSMSFSFDAGSSATTNIQVEVNLDAIMSETVNAVLNQIMNEVIQEQVNTNIIETIIKDTNNTSNNFQLILDVEKL